MKKFDKEYFTQWIEEVQWLKANGIPYSFVKVNEYGVTTYKYKKTSELFNNLALFYAQKDRGIDKDEKENNRRTYKSNGSIVSRGKNL